MVELGQSGVQVTALGLGTWAWGDNLYWGYGRGYGESDLQAAFEASLRAGITFLDTAEVYGFGRSEKFIAEFRRESPLDDTVQIATKFFPGPWRFTRGALLRALRGSLRRLQVQRVDLYQIHWHSPLVPIERWMDGLAEAVQLGLARAVGVSNYNAAQVRRAHARLARHGIPLASNQIEYNLLQRAPEFDGTMDACRELGVTVIAYSPLKLGLLTGKYTPSNPPRGARGRQFSYAYLTAIGPLIAALRELGEKYAKSPSQVAINWVLARGAVAIPGAKNEKQALENAGAGGWQLSPDDVAFLNELTTRVYQTLT